MDISRRLTAHVVADQFTDRGGKIEINGIDILGDEAVLQCPVSCFPDAGGFGMEAEMVEQHRCGEDAAEGIGDIFSGGLWIGAVDRFEKCGAFADGSGRDCQARRFGEAAFIEPRQPTVTQHITDEFKPPPGGFFFGESLNAL